MKWRRLAGGLLACILLLCALVWWLRNGVQDWLIVEDPLQPAVAIAVLGGKMPFRAMEAAELYRRGFANEIWLPGAEGAAEHEPIKRMGFEPSDPDLYNKVLRRLEIPADAVRQLQAAPVKNTREEVELIAARLSALGGGRIIIVTSPTHTRRVRVLWNAIAVRGNDAVLRYTRYEPRQEPLDRWWEREEARHIVVRELGGVVDAWLGFPMRLLGR